MINSPITSIYVKLDADLLKFLANKLAPADFYKMLPCCLNEPELELIKKSTLEVIVTDSFKLNKWKSLMFDGSEYPLITPTKLAFEPGAKVSPSPIPCMDLTGHQ
jgi:hypothetical protein